MKELFNRLFKISIISSFICLIFGIILLTETEEVLITLAVFIGLILLILGFVSILNYFKDYGKGYYVENDFLMGIFLITLSLIFLLNKCGILFNLIPTITGCWLLISGFYKVQLSMNLKVNSSKMWIWIIIYTIFTIVLGLLLIINPFNAIVYVNRVLAIIIIGYSTIDVVNILILKSKVKKIIKEIKKPFKK